MAPPIEVKQQQHRPDASRLNILIVGAGLGGLGAAISLLLAGHTVHILESAKSLTEVGAGIQVLPNSSRVLCSWGLEKALSEHWTRPDRVNFWGWKGDLISYMGFEESAARFPGTWYGDFHRANLHRVLVERVIELGGTVETGARVVDVKIAEGDGGEGNTAVAVLGSGEVRSADLLIGADGVFSELRNLMLGFEDPPTKTGDLAYRLLLDTEDMMDDSELADLVHNPQVNYWLGPDAHAVNYVLRGGKLFNMVLLVPDDIPEGPPTVEGNVEEMQAYYRDWDPRIPKLLRLCKSVQKWRLCIRLDMPSWNHPSGAWTMLGDAVHATLPYLASGAGMSFEDGAVLGECLSRLPYDSKATTAQKNFALSVYERCRKARTRMVVERGNVQQELYHLHDGLEQEERDRKMKMVPTPAGEALAWRDPGLKDQLLGYKVEEDVEAAWEEMERELERGAKISEGETARL